MDNMSDRSDRGLRPVAFWQLHKNPILLRYIRSRMRWNGLFAALILTLVVSVFTYVVSYNAAVKFAQESSVDAYRAAFLPMFLIQVVIIMFIGTGSVTSGITQEYEDEMVDYHRLTPMTPMAKIVGYVFGLPIREWFLFGVTSVFVGIIVVKGEVPMSSVWPVYSIFFLSILLYHLMALVVVHSMTKKRVAGRVIQLLVLLLYFAFPLLSQFGLVFFEYLTVRPILKECMLEYIPEKSGFIKLLNGDGGGSTVAFFEYKLEAWSFSVILMSSLIISFLVMLCRRWKSITSHLMSKPFAVLFFGFFMLFLVGNTLPIAKDGEMSITQSIRDSRQSFFIDKLSEHRQSDRMRERYVKRMRDFDQVLNYYKPLERPFTQTMFGAVCFLLACVVVYIVTPRHDKYLLGLRRARNLKKWWVPLHWDEAPGLLATLVVIGTLSVALYSFSTTLYSGPTMPLHVVGLVSFIPVVIGYAGVAVLVFYAVYEAWENRGLFFLILFVWVLPIMVAMVMGLKTDHYPTLVWVSSVSPLAGYGFGMTDFIGLPCREAFYFSFGLQVFIGVFAMIALVGRKLEGRKLILKKPVDL